MLVSFAGDAVTNIICMYVCMYVCVYVCVCVCVNLFILECSVTENAFNPLVQYILY